MVTLRTASQHRTAVSARAPHAPCATRTTTWCVNDAAVIPFVGTAVGGFNALAIDFKPYNQRPKEIPL